MRRSVILEFMEMAGEPIPGLYVRRNRRNCHHRSRQVIAAIVANR